jgi:hypothetical protein
MLRQIDNASNPQHNDRDHYTPAECAAYEIKYERQEVVVWFTLPSKPKPD